MGCVVWGLGLGFGVSDLGLGFWGLGFGAGIWRSGGQGFEVWDVTLGVRCLGFEL